jgi:NitT/TauT family transport system permease protein
MADALSGTPDAAVAAKAGRVFLLRLAIIVALLAAWEAIAASGLLYRDVVPSLPAIGRALLRLILDPVFYGNMAITLGEVGGSRFLAGAYEPFVYYLGPTPKIIFFPVMIMWFGVGAGSKVAMGALSCFFPIAISVAAGLRQVDGVLIRVGRSFGATPLQMLTRIYLPAMRRPIVNGARLGLGVAITGTLLAETKLSNRGLGYLIIQTYTTFDMPRMYALLMAVFVLAIGANALMGRLAGADRFER